MNNSLFFFVFSRVYIDTLSHCNEPDLVIRPIGACASPWGANGPHPTHNLVLEALERMKTALVDAQSNLSTAQQRMKRAVDKKRRTEEFKVGDEVVLTTANLRTYCPHIPPKIKARWVGPFRIIKEVSPVAFGLDLPPGWRIHPVFHVSKFKRYIRSEEFLWEVAS